MPYLLMSGCIRKQHDNIVGIVFIHSITAAKISLEWIQHAAAKIRFAKPQLEVDILEIRFGIKVRDRDVLDAIVHRKRIN